MSRFAYCALSGRIERAFQKKIPCLIFFAEKIFCLSLTALFKRQHCLCSSLRGSRGCCALSLLIKSNDAETKVLYVCLLKGSCLTRCCSSRNSLRPLPTWLLLLLVTLPLPAWPLEPGSELAAEAATAEAVRVAAMPCASPLLRQEVELFISVLRMPLEELELLLLEVGLEMGGCLVELLLLLPLELRLRTYPKVDLTLL